MRRRGWGGPQLPALFKIGAVGGLTDGELLGRFATRDGEAAELAFEALVERHGPMVLRVCRSVLRDEHAAEDALQATFLVLVRRAESVRKQDSVGAWLHGVALRVSACSRVASARRRKHEKRASELATAGPQDARDEFDLAPVLHEELRRLPERYRAVVVLCHLEGLTCEEAAVRLKCPAGTVKSRLARGRQRLRDRLARRGLAPSAGAVAMALGAEASSAALPSRLVESTARIASLFVEGQAATLGAIPASVAALARRTLTLMMMKNLAFSMTVFLGLAAASAGISSFARGTPDDPPAEKARAAPKGEDETPVRPEPVLEDALRAADQITESWLKAYVLGQIAVAQAHMGQKEASHATFQRVAKIIEQDGDEPRSRSAGLDRLAMAQAMAGDLDAARATVDQVLEWSLKIEDKNRRQLSLRSSAWHQAKAGDVPGALVLFRALENAPAWMRAFVLSEIAGEQAKKGDLAGARATMTSANAEAKRVEAVVKEMEAHPERAEKGPPVRGGDNSPSARYARQVVQVRSELNAVRMAQVRGLAPLAEAEAKAGQIEAARAWLKQARAIADELDDDWRPAPLAQIAMAQKKVGDQDAAEATLALAVATARTLSAPSQRPVGLARVATEQVDAGDRAGARKTLERVVEMAESDRGKSTLAQYILAGVLPKVGDWEQARKTALNIDSDFIRANNVQGVAFEQSKAGELREALKWAEAQSDTLLRAHALLGVVRGIIEREPRDSGD